MLLANYASDSDGGSDSEIVAVAPTKRDQPKTTASIPPAVPAVKPKKKGPVKITLDLPKSSTEGKQERDEGLSDAQNGEGHIEGDDDEAKGVKKLKLGAGGGKGS